jgi:hypothetical protein
MSLFSPDLHRFVILLRYGLIPGIYVHGKMNTFQNQPQGTESWTLRNDRNTPACQCVGLLSSAHRFPIVTTPSWAVLVLCSQVQDWLQLTVIGLSPVLSIAPYAWSSHHAWPWFFFVVLRCGLRYFMYLCFQSRCFTVSGTLPVHFPLGSPSLLCLFWFQAAILISTSQVTRIIDVRHQNPAQHWSFNAEKSHNSCSIWFQVCCSSCLEHCLRQQG